MVPSQARGYLRRMWWKKKPDPEPLTYAIQLHRKGEPPSEFERFFVLAWEDAEAVGTVADIFRAIGAEPYYATLARHGDQICTWGNPDA